MSWQLRCDSCAAAEQSAHDIICRACGGLLSVEHHVADAAGLRGRFRASRSPSGVWRYADVVLPDVTNVVSYPEGNTPLIERPALCAWTGIDRLQIKHEGLNPTGSFKDRGMTVGVTHARDIGARIVACASTGNTSSSLAAYAAQAGLTAVTLVPRGKVAVGKLAQTLAYGARTLEVDGDFDDCLRLLRESAAQLGVHVVNSVNPFRIEGQKTIVLEMLEQRGWTPPDWIVLPAGNLGNTAAFGKAIREAMAWGLIDRAPRIAAIQAAGAAPFAAAYRRGFDRLEPVEPDTIATAIRIGAPASYARAVRAIRDTDGVAIAVGDDEILAAKAAIDRAGVGCEPASAAALAGARQLRNAGVIAADASVVAVLTGHILKDSGAPDSAPRDNSMVGNNAGGPHRIAATVDALQRAVADGFPTA